MPRWIIIGSLTVAVLAVFGVSWHVSSWFVWHLLPPDSANRIVINPSADRTAGQAAVVFSWWKENEFQPYVPFVRRLGYARSGGREVLVLVPRILQYQAVQKKLTQAAWVVERRGWVIRATRPDPGQGLPTAAGAYVKSLSMLFRGAAAPRPWSLGVANTDVTAWLQKPLHFLAYTWPEHLEVQLTTADQLPFMEARPPVPDTDLYVTAPGTALAHLPPHFQQRWDDLLRQRLAFTKTKPTLFNAAQELPGIIVAIDGEETALGAVGKPADFIKQATGWLEEEERHNRLITRSFRLPDGTKGFERVPAKAQRVVEPSLADENCLTPLAGRTPLVICWRADQVLLATSTAFARRLLAEPAFEWAITLKKPFLTAFPLPAVEKITARGAGTDGVVELFFSPKNGTDVK